MLAMLKILKELMMILFFYVNYGKRFFINYKFSIREGVEKFEMCGGPRKMIYSHKSKKLNLIYII